MIKLKILMTTKMRQTRFQNVTINKEILFYFEKKHIFALKLKTMIKVMMKLKRTKMRQIRIQEVLKK